MILIARGNLRLRQGPRAANEKALALADAALLEQLAAMGFPEARIGLGRIVALYHRSSILYQIH